MVSPHKCLIGQTVNYRPSERGQDAPPGNYHIIGLLPRGQDGMFEYRIKHSDEVHERTAKESELRGV
jgi:hypothetical protein